MLPSVLPAPAPLKASPAPIQCGSNVGIKCKHGMLIWGGAAKAPALQTVDGCRMLPTASGHPSLPTGTGAARPLCTPCSTAHWQATTCAAALAGPLAALQPACGARDSALLATGAGLFDAAPALAALDADSSTGLIYLRAGSRHPVASSLTVSKPL